MSRFLDPCGPCGELEDHRRLWATEPTIGHLKADHRMDRCWLKRTEGDALHAVLPSTDAWGGWTNFAGPTQ